MSALFEPGETRMQAAAPRVSAVLSPQSGITWYRRPLLIATLLILALGAVEDLYGKTDAGDVYGSDAVQYMDIARAMGRHDLRSALNPLWSQGYPALLALLHALFPATPGGDWWTTRAANFLVFAASYAAFLYFVFGLPGFLPFRSTEIVERRQRYTLIVCLCFFAAIQTCLGQVSRINPDELVTAFFLFASGQLARVYRRACAGEPTRWSSAPLLGLTLGLGFLVKTIFFPLGCGMLGIALAALWSRRANRAPLLAAFCLFAAILGGYAAALSHAVGYRTLGDSGDINYAWHVDRLHKWVHWEGGVQPAGEAWPRPSVARFAQWSTHPPDFGKPLHPSVILQRSPLVYGFAAPMHATYVPYFDPPFFYRGYRRIFRVRYQLIAIVKSVGDLLELLVRHPLAWAGAFVLVLLLRTPGARSRFIDGLRDRWPLVAASILGVLYYLLVHLEGRYLAGMMLVLGVCGILSAAALPGPLPRAGSLVLLLGLASELAVYQGPVWRNAVRGQSMRSSSEWRMGLAALDQHLPPLAPVGVISWTPSLHCDWAYIAHLQITSEIASGPDYEQFWHASLREQAATLDTFRRAGALAVFVDSKPPGLGGPEWHQLNGTPLWMASLQ